MSLQDDEERARRQQPASSAQAGQVSLSAAGATS
jgi:hypothetical protein